VGPPSFALESGVVVFKNDSLFFMGNEYSEHFFRYTLSYKKDRIRIVYPFNVVNPTTIKVYAGFRAWTMTMSPPEVQFLRELFERIFAEAKLRCEEENKLLEIKAEQNAKILKQGLKKLASSKTALMKVFDRDGNGIIDVVEGDDDFMNLLKKHQKKVIEIDKQYVQIFIKLGNYLKTKRRNLQTAFLSIENINDARNIEEFQGLLKNQIHTYEALLLHSLSMITAVSEDDLITFYEIYEAFDKLKVFNSNWENELSQKLSNIGDGLSGLMRSVETMERNIVSGLNELTYHTQEGFSELNHSITRELQSINSSVEFNNLLTGISTYQLYKINKQTKGLTE